MNEPAHTKAAEIRNLSILSMRPITAEQAHDAAYAIVPTGYKLEDLEAFHDQPCDFPVQ